MTDTPPLRGYPIDRDLVGVVHLERARRAAARKARRHERAGIVGTLRRLLQT